MGLATYKKKRQFTKTPEPAGGKSTRGGQLRFVVQEHHARRHHYDFRLELGGTLKSWAVPKGPSLDAGDKRLAVQTEDHPLEYLTFHGEIPAGNYGAGTIKIWDHGTFHALEAKDPKKTEEVLLQGLKSGKLTFILSGKKLQGEYALVKMRGKEDNAWLLIKAQDASQKNHTAPGQAAKQVRVQVGKHIVNLTNLSKVYWPKEGYTKGDLIAYYQSVASVILPHLRDRPQSLNRHPDGIEGSNFFQKNMGHQPPPEWVETVMIHSDREKKDIRYLLCQDEATLLYVANLGCIELNPWLSRRQALDEPDYLAIDLDPEDIAFDRVVEAAQEVRKQLERIGAPGYCKTSGKSGLHIYVPLGARYNYDQAKQFAELIGTLVNRELPKTTSLFRSPSKRQQRVYLDYLQNRKGQTLASVYSVRPVPGATVSTPLKWSEVRKGLDPGRYTMITTMKRLDKLGDLWESMLTEGIDLLACLERLQKSMKPEDTK